MRYVRKKAQDKIIEYYKYCYEKYWEMMDKNNEYAAENWAGKIAAIEKIYQIVKEHGYTKE